MKPSTLTGFVRDVLGCSCPEDVLRSISVDRGRLMPVLDIELVRLDVGGRLLIYIVSVPATQPLHSVVGAAIRSGVSERDRRAFNRFRLVLAAADPSVVEPSARDAFAACEQIDERVHLHVVSVEELRALS